MDVWIFFFVDVLFDVIVLNLMFDYFEKVVEIELSFCELYCVLCLGGCLFLIFDNVVNLIVVVCNVLLMGLFVMIGFVLYYVGKIVGLCGLC